MKKKFITAYGGLILLLCASSGILAGVINGNGGGTTSVVDTDDESILNKYITIPTKKVDDFLSEDSSNSYKNVLYATNTVFAKSSKYITTSSTGTVLANVAGIPYNQSIATKRIINDQDTFFQTNTISTFVKKSEQRYTNNNSYLVRQGNNPTIDGADYSSSQVEALSKKSYMERYGHTNRDIFNYAINDNSFASGTYDGKKEDGLYYFTYTLNPSAATAAYVREVAYMAGSSSYPVFSKISFTIGIDEDYRIMNSTVNEKYTTPILGGLNCEGTSNEIFTYYSSSVDCPEKSAFEPYFGKETGEITKDKTAMDYLTQLGDDMSVFNNLQLQGNVKLNEEELALKLKLDLENNAFYVDIDDMLDVIYSSSNAYVLTDNSSFLVSKEELSNVLKLVAGDVRFDSNTLISLMNDPFVSKIMNDMTVSKVDSYVDINIPFTDDSKVVLHLYENDDSSVSIKGVEANLKYETYDLSAKFDVVNNDLTFKQIPTSVTEITNISPIASKVKEIVDKKAFYGQISFDENVNVNNTSLPISINGSYYVDLKDENNPIYKFELVVNVNSQDINVIIDGCKDDFYVQVGDNFKAYTTYNDLINLLNSSISSEVKLPNISIKQVFNSLVDVIDNLDFYKDSIEFNLDYLNIDYLNGKIKLSHSQDLKLSYNDNLSITLIPFDGSLTKVSYDDAVNLTDVVNAVNPYLNGNYNINLNNFEYQGVLVNGSVNVQADFNDIENSNISGNVSVIYKDITANVEFYYVGKKLYVKLNDNTKLYLSTTDFKELLNQFLPDVSLDMPSVDLSSIDLLSIINSISTSSSSISIDLSKLTSSKFNYDAVIDLNSNNMSLVEKGSSSKEITLNALDAASFNFDKENYTNGRPIVNSLINLFNKVKNQDISSEFNSDIKYNGITYSIKGIISYKKVGDSYQASVTITSPITFKLICTGSEFYIDVESSHIKFDKASLLNVLDQVKNTYGLDDSTVTLIKNIIDSGLDQYLSKLNDLSSLFENVDSSNLNIALNINSLFNSITTKDNKLVININLSSFTNVVSSVELVIDENNKVESISVPSVNVSGLDLSNISLYNIATSAQASVNSEISYLDLSSLANFNSLQEINNLINNKVYSINVGETTISGVTLKGTISYLDISKLDLSLFKQSTIKIEDLINIITLSGEFNVKYDSISLNIQVNVNNGNIQIKLLDNDSGLTFGGTYSDIVKILDNVKGDFAKSLKKFISDLDLSSVVLPLTIVNTSSNNTSIDSIIDLLKNNSINSIVKNVKCDENGKLDVELDLSSFNINGVSSVKLSYINSNLSVNVSGLTSINLTSASKVDSFDSSYGITTTCSFDDLNNLVSSLTTMLESRTFSGTLNLTNINISLKIKDIYSLLGLDTSKLDDSTIDLGSNISVNYQVDLDNKFDFYLDIAFNVKNVLSDTSKGGNINLKAEHLIISKVGTNIYFKLSNIVSMLTYDEWIDVVKYLSSELELNLNINYNSIKTTLDELSKGLDSYIKYLSTSSTSLNSSSSSILDLFDINSIINSISYKSIDSTNGELYVRLPLGKIANKYNINFINLSNLGVTYNTKDGQLLLSESIDGSVNYLNVDSSSIKKIDATNYVTASSLKSVIDELVAIKSTLSQKQFVISTSSDTSSNYVSKDSKKLFDYSGKVVIDTTDKLKFTANNVTLNAYSYDDNGNCSTSSHNFSLTYLPSYINNGETIEKDSFFINYGSNLKGYLSRVEFASLAQYGCDLMGINNSLINGLLSNLGSADSLDTDVFSGITSSASMPNFDINLDNLFDNYTISKDDNGNSFEITLNAVDFYKSLYGEEFNKDNTDPNKNKVTLKVNSNSDRTNVSKIKLANMYSSSQEVFNIDLDINNSISEDELSLLDTIDVTNTNNELGKYYYIGNIPTLLKAFANTANLEKYHVSGSFSMALGKWKLQNIGYDIKIVLDEDKHPYIEVTFNVNKLALVMNGGESKLLYSPLENRFYLRNNKSKKNKSYSYSDPNASDYIGKSSNIAEIINTILNSTSLISGTIESSVSNTSTNIDINTLLKNYSYTYDESALTGTTNVTLAGDQFMSSLGNLNLHLTNKEIDMQLDSSTSKHGDYLTDFTFDTTMSVITISGNGSFKNSSEITSEINVDTDLLAKAIANPSGWSF